MIFKRNFWLFLVIFLEGYVVLSSEILAIRQLVPFVGNGIEAISIIISAVLVPLSFGYYFGGIYKGKVRLRLVQNLLQANILLVLGLSSNLLDIYFGILTFIRIKHYFVQTCIYSSLFILYPIFLLGQTIPLISKYLKNKNLPKITGKILFTSTFGSFLGSILNSLIFMPFLGVNSAVIITILSLFFAVFVMEKHTFSYNNITGLFTIVTCILINLTDTGVIKNNGYSTIRIIENEDSKMLLINNSYSAKIAKKPENNFEYLKFIEEKFLNSLMEDINKIYDILVIGAGGFTIGLKDNKNEYTYVDIDKSLQEISEKYFLQKPLGENKKFIAIPARAFVRNTDKKRYDLIVLDAYTHHISVPFQLITTEFFQAIKYLLKEDGKMIFNIITQPNFTDKFSRKLDNTIRKNFPNCNREVIKKESIKADKEMPNIIYSCFNYNDTDIYTDNRNSYFLDKKN